MTIEQRVERLERRNKRLTAALTLMAVTPDDTGGMLQVFNKTGEGIVQMGADEYGNGVVGAFNRKGKGRTLQP